MEKLAKEALEKITDRVLEIFKRDYILKYAYIDSPKMYERTMEFEKAWDFTSLKKEINRISTELWYDSSKLITFEPEKKFIHGSKYSSPPDVRDNLPAILEGKRSSLWMSVERRVKFWEAFINEMFDRGTLDKIITEEFKAVGFTKT